MTLSSRTLGIAAALTAVALALPGCSQNLAEYNRALPASAAADAAAFVGSRQPADASELPDADAAAATAAAAGATQPANGATPAEGGGAAAAPSQDPTAYISAIDGLPVPNAAQSWDAPLAVKPGRHDVQITVRQGDIFGAVTLPRFTVERGGRYVVAFDKAGKATHYCKSIDCLKASVWLEDARTNQKATGKYALSTLIPPIAISPENAVKYHGYASAVDRPM
ncbi:MAG TPA: hypothetical protein VGD08_04425 [Stellaceae bacterium]